MVTVEQESVQSQTGNASPQTQNPQTLVPTNLQPNVGRNDNLQRVINNQSLFSNPQANAVITIEGANNTQALLAGETEPKKAPNNSVANSLLLVSVAVAIVVGSYFIFKLLGRSR